MKIAGLILLFVFAVSGTYGQNAIGNFKIAEGFVIKAVGDDVEARFNALEGTIRFDPQDLTAAMFDVKVDAASIETGIDLKNNHARSGQWLNAVDFPAIRFFSNSIKATENGYTAFGELELHGITQGIELPFQFKDNVFSGDFDIQRNDYKIGKSGSKIAPVLHITLTVPVVLIPEKI